MKETYTADVAVEIVGKLRRIIDDEHFEYETVREDIEGDMYDSTILGALDDIDAIAADSERVKLAVQRIMRASGAKRRLFDIRAFDFEVSAEELKKTGDFTTAHLPFVYHHLMGVAPAADGVKAAGMAMCTAKAADLKNGQHIFCWMLSLFHKQRAAKLRADRALHDYSSTDWWRENAFCAWIRERFPSVAEHYASALEEVVKRLLVPITFRRAAHAQLICDRLDDFAEYALAFHEVALKVRRLMALGDFEGPVQIDYWIIPQMARTRGADEQAASNPWSADELKASDDSDGAVEFGDDEAVAVKLESPFVPTRQGEIWDLEPLLRDARNGYREGVDLFMDHAADSFEHLHRNLYHMIAKHRAVNNKRRTARNRYIFIIDRRHPDNLRQRALAHDAVFATRKTWPDKIYLVGPKLYRDEDDARPLCVCGWRLKQVAQSALRCTWCGEHGAAQRWECPKNGSARHQHASDQLQLRYALCLACERARPSTFSRLPTQCAQHPEAAMALSRRHTLLVPKDRQSLSFEDGLRGYQFGFSHHILGEDDVSAYWYVHGGGGRFELRDMQWAWPRLFDRVDGQPQRLSSDIVRDIKSCKALRSKEFDEFERQCNELEKQKTKVKGRDTR